MDKASIVRADFAKFEAQFVTAPAVTALSRGRRRATGWIGAAIVSLALWGTLIAGAVALFR
jgi:hypothetical protein